MRPNFSTLHVYKQATRKPYSPFFTTAFDLYRGLISNTVQYQAVEDLQSSTLFQCYHIKEAGESLCFDSNICQNKRTPPTPCSMPASAFFRIILKTFKKVFHSCTSVCNIKDASDHAIMRTYFKHRPETSVPQRMLQIESRFATYALIDYADMGWQL